MTRSTRASALPPASTRSPPITAARKSPACWPAPKSPPKRVPPRTGCCAPRRRDFSRRHSGARTARTRNLEIPGLVLRTIPELQDQYYLPTHTFIQALPLGIFLHYQTSFPPPPPFPA